jgi:hypothetical protein
MARRRGNPNWGKPEVGPAVIVPSQFETLVEKLGLAPEEYASSRELREWTLRNRNERYVPEALLNEWRLDVAED